MAFVATRGAAFDCSSIIEELSKKVEAYFEDKKISKIDIEQIQDQLELELMRSKEDYCDVARRFIIYRRERERTRQEIAKTVMNRDVRVTLPSGRKIPFDVETFKKVIYRAAEGFEDVNADEVFDKALNEIYDGITVQELEAVPVLATRPFLEKDPAYSYMATRLLLDNIKKETNFFTYEESFLQTMREGLEQGTYNPKMKTKFRLRKLAQAIVPDRDNLFKLMGLKTLLDRYLTRTDKKKCIEMPQTFFMRVAMGIALNEDNPTERAIEFYNLLSSFDFMCSTPTLFNSGTRHSQLSSCYISVIDDSIEGIYDGLKENATLSKFAGGIGNSWTNVRASGSHIKGTRGTSSGVVPFLHANNATMLSSNQGGKRRGSAAVYLEPWHLDVEAFCDLRKPTGDFRIRAHDLFTAIWANDLFIERVMNKSKWTLFSPSDVPELHDSYGKEFETLYCQHEAEFDEGTLRGKRIEAVDLWRRILTSLFETGGPWMTFKDPCNIRSPQQHVGVVHSSNLCTEITLNTSETETAVCNLGSINLLHHLKDGEIDEAHLEKTVRTAMRMLDNVIDVNYYPTAKAKRSNLANRPVGLGLMGFQDCLYEMKIHFNSKKAVEFADQSMERISYHAINASCDLAKERGQYSTYKGSLWSKGILPIDSLKMLADSRGNDSFDFSSVKDWTKTRNKIKRYGMRNSNCMAIAPTATIANIIGVTACIEPTYQNLFTKSNLSGEFIVINEYLVKDLKNAGIWDNNMIMELKAAEGDVAKIGIIPDNLKHKYPSVFDIDPKWLIACAAARQKWIDQSQSLNLYIREPNGKKISDAYLLAWKSGLKTTYYLRSLSATTTEKYTSKTTGLSKVCNLDDEECTSCQ